MSTNKRLSKKDIDRAFKEGKTVKGSFFLLKALRGSGRSRIAIVVSKKIAPTAVDRTSIRRRLRHAIVDVLPKTPAVDLVCIVTGPILRKDYSEIKSQLEQNIKKLFVQL